ncbi:hypothetical protein HanPSC8_Chr04g0176141 [Helianthus annuus]|nr:hypothetical protein HanPSC8_Chr04g0176141 [Helianthus annuus]
MCGYCLTNGIVKIVCICNSLVCNLVNVYFLFISLGIILVIQYLVEVFFSNQVKLDFEFFTSVVFRSWFHILKNRVIFSLNDITVILLMDCVFHCILRAILFI